MRDSNKHSDVQTKMVEGCVGAISAHETVEYIYLDIRVLCAPHACMQIMALSLSLSLCDVVAFGERSNDGCQKRRPEDKGEGEGERREEGGFHRTWHTGTEWK